MAFDIGALSGILGDLGKMLPSTNDLANQVVTGAVASVVMAGLKSQSGLDAIDPLHIIHPNGASTVVGGKTITAAAFASLPPASQAQILAAGYVIAG